MRYSDMKIPRILFTLTTIVFVGLAWGMMTSGWLRAGTPAPQAAADAAPPQVYRAVLVTGTVRSAERGVLGQVRSVVIVVPKVGSFRVADSGKGRDLKDHVGDTVTVIAMTRLDGEGREVLDVEGYSIDAS